MSLAAIECANEQSQRRMRNDEVVEEKERTNASPRLNSRANVPPIRTLMSSKTNTEIELPSRLRTRWGLRTRFPIRAERFSSLSGAVEAEPAGARSTAVFPSEFRNEQAQKRYGNSTSLCTRTQTQGVSVHIASGLVRKIKTYSTSPDSSLTISWTTGAGTIGNCASHSHGGESAKKLPQP